MGKDATMPIKMQGTASQEKDMPGEIIVLVFGCDYAKIWWLSLQAWDERRIFTVQSTKWKASECLLNVVRTLN